MNPRDARRVIATLRSAAQDRSDPSPPAEWRARRDQLIDILDPAGGQGRPSRQQIRSLVDFLGEATHSAASRQSTDEWAAAVELAVEHAISALRLADEN